jgi:hypothetical protein
MRKMLAEAASSVTTALPDGNPVERLAIRAQEKAELRKIVAAYPGLRERGLGLNLVMNCAERSIGLDAAEALSEAMGLRMATFPLQQVLFSDRTFRWAAADQRITAPWEYMFAEGLGRHALVALIDFDLAFPQILKDHANSPISEMDTFLDGLRNTEGAVLVITRNVREEQVPREFHRSLTLCFPSEEMQVERWERHLDPKEGGSSRLARLVERHPMRLKDIDFIARQATTRDLLSGGSGNVGIDQVEGIVDTPGKHGRTTDIFAGATDKSR